MRNEIFMEIMFFVCLADDILMFVIFPEPAIMTLNWNQIC